MATSLAAMSLVNHKGLSAATAQPKSLKGHLRRFQMLRFSSRVGFKPPYFYNRPLRNRLHRITSPALVIWGEKDSFGKKIGD